VLIADVNVLINANREGARRHIDYKRWLDERLSGAEPFGVSELVLGAFVRLMTNHRVADPALSPDEAIAYCDAVRLSPAAVVVAPGVRHWDIFCDLVRTTNARANLVPDAYLAALAIEHNATFVTSDRGFARFAGLRLMDPLAE
jgi:toxin-antitoxin system PIN domain toxin